MNIIQYLLSVIHSLYQQNIFLTQFICRYVPLKQWAYEDTKSQKYQKFKTDVLPKIIPFEKKDYQHLLREYQRSHDGKILPPVRRRRECDIPSETRCPCCNAPVDYLYRNNGSRGQL